MNENTPTITIIMPLYNKEREIARAINSVQSQTFSNYELLVIDDGSTDRSPAIVATYSDPRIKMIRQENAGVSAARNHGLSLARADLVAFLDADDEWVPDYLKTIIHLRSQYPYCKVFATSYVFQSLTTSRPALLRGIPSSPWEGVIKDYFRLASDSDPPLSTSAVTVEKAAINRIGGFPVGIASGEDLLTWARLAIQYPIAYSTFSGAVHWNPKNVQDRPGRFQNTDDQVGHGLAMLLGEAPMELVPSIKSYIGRWHEMRAVIFLQLGEKSKCLREIGSVLHFRKVNTKLLVLCLLLILPQNISQMLYLKLRKIMETFRLHSW